MSRNKVGQYFVSILVDEEIPHLKKSNKITGIDVGLDHLVTLSDGTKINNPRWFRESQSKLAKAQQYLSRKQRGSNRYSKQKIKIAKIHLKIANQRSWFIHNLTTWLVKEYDGIFTEDLNIAGMVKNGKLSKSIHDASWGELVRQLKYKSMWYGKVFDKVDQYFASSKTCSNCDYKMGQMPLSIRTWTCPSCDTTHDRDINAAVNIKNQAMSQLYNWLELVHISEESPENIRGEEVRLGVHPNLASSMKRKI